MTSPWDVLGIEPTRDRRQIRSAYAARLKCMQPEDDPAGFQRLREAYESAIAFATPAVPFSRPTPPRSTPLELSAAPRPHAAIDELTARVETLYAGEQRWSEAAWRELLSHDALWSLDVRDQFQDELFGFLLEHRDLPSPVWRLLEEEFQWTVLSRSLYSRYDPDEVDEVLDEIHDAVGNDPDARYELEPIVEDERSGGAPWWGLLLFLLFFRGLGSLNEPDPAERANRARAAIELMRQSQAARASMLAEIEAATRDPALFETMPQETLELAAERQVLEAQWELGRRYLEADGVGRNDSLARLWLRRAAANGHEGAVRELERFGER